jgi:hypothetical protein
LQSLLLLPLTPFAYHVLAEAAELIRHKTVSSNAVVRPVCFTIVSFSSRQLRWTFSRLGATAIAIYLFDYVGPTALFRRPKEEGKK